MQTAAIYISCPFCNETDFDLIGLKIHILRGWCDVFNELEISEDFEFEKRAAILAQVEKD